MSNQLKKKHSSIFTSREAECIKQATQGKNLIEISTNLNISEQTAYFYINAIIKKLGLLIKEV